MDHHQGLLRMGMGRGVFPCPDENTAGLALPRSLYKLALFSREKINILKNIY